MFFFSLQSVPEAAGIPRAEAAGAEAPEGAARRGGTIKKGKSQNLPILPQNIPGFFLKRLFRVWRCVVVIGWCGCQSE